MSDLTTEYEKLKRLEQNALQVKQGIASTLRAKLAELSAERDRINMEISLVNAQLAEIDGKPVQRPMTPTAKEAEAEKQFNFLQSNAGQFFKGDVLRTKTSTVGHPYDLLEDYIKAKRVIRSGSGRGTTYTVPLLAKTATSTGDFGF